jgi:pimeloyl-ACP methyl ester carboxylesterase
MIRREVNLPVEAIDNAVQTGAMFLPSKLGDTALSAVILFHEFGYSKEQSEGYAEAITREVGAVCLALDLLGHGRHKPKSDLARFTFRDQLKGARNAYRHLIPSSSNDARIVDSTRVGLIGSSFGAPLAVALSAEPGAEVKSQLLRAPAVYPNEFWDLYHQDYAIGAHSDGNGNEVIPKRQELEEFRRTSALLDGTQIMENVRNFDGPLTVVACGEDKRIPGQVIEAYLRAAKNPEYIIIENAEHMLDSNCQARFTDIAVEWAAKL